MTNKKHGGARPGSGPKPKPEQRKQRISFTLPPHQVEWLKEQENASETIRNLIEHELRARTRRQKETQDK